MSCPRVFEMFIKANSFEALSNLTKLNLKCRGFKTFPDYLFRNQKNLKELSLSTCYGKLNKKHFYGLDNLEILDLQHFKFDKIAIDKDVFETLVNLKKLTFTFIEFNGFTLNGLDNLETLNLIEIKFTAKTPKNLFHNLKNLKNFKLDRMLLNRDADNVITYSENELSHIKEVFQSMPSNVEIFESGNIGDWDFVMLNTIPINFTFGLKNLEIFVHRLNANNRCIDFFLENFLNHKFFPKLENVRLFNCTEMWQNIYMKQYNLMRNLKSLEVQGFTLVDNDFVLTNLEELKIAYEIPNSSLVLCNLKKLILFDLKHKTISLSEHFLEGLIYLEELKLLNCFHSIDSNARYLFKTLTKLKILRLGNNNSIPILKSSYFDFLVNLEQLTWVNNKTSEIESGSFKNLKVLQHLNLSRNNLHELDKTILEGLLELQVLKLEKNENVHFKKDALLDMKKLKEFILE